MQLVGKTVAEATTELRETLSLARGVKAFRNGEEAAPETVLEAGDTLEFYRPAGKKG